MNITRPHDPEHSDDLKSLSNTAMIFARAIGNLLEEGTGIVIDITGEARNPAGFSDKVMVFNMNGNIHIEDLNEDLPEGSIHKIQIK